MDRPRANHVYDAQERASASSEPSGAWTPILPPVDSQGEPLRLEAYYYGFEPTGVPATDRVLAAVACAGKAYHHTESWSDDTRPYEDVFRGETPADWIQYAAEDAADLIRTLYDALSELVFESSLVPLDPDIAEADPKAINAAERKARSALAKASM